MEDKLPPHSAAAEEGLLSCVLLAPATALPEAVLAVGGADAFYDLRNQRLFAELLAMQDDRVPIEPDTLPVRLRERGALDAVGGLARLSQLYGVSPSAAALPYHAEVVRDKHLLRRMLATCAEASIRIQQLPTDEPPQDLLAWVEQRVLEVRRRLGVRSQDTAALAAAALAELERLYHTDGAIAGLPTGHKDLDRACDGLHPGEMTVAAAFPSTGKTALACGIAHHIAVAQLKPVLLFSLEMSGRQIAQRMLCSAARINARDLRSMDERDFDRLTLETMALRRSKLEIDDSSDMSIYELRARCRQAAQRHGKLGLVVVDYLQLLTAQGGARRPESRQQEVADISRGLKGVANELEVPVLALSQLNDDGKLRESRSIGQDADGIWELSKAEGDTDEVATIWLTITKQRNGPAPVRIPLTLLKRFTRFEDAAPPSMVPPEEEPKQKRSKWGKR